MHIEKNVCENMYGTILGLEGKSKDNLREKRARPDWLASPVHAAPGIDRGINSRSHRGSAPLRDLFM
jgi:hypothetical protein